MSTDVFSDTDFEVESGESEGRLRTLTSCHYSAADWKRELVQHSGWAVTTDPLSAGNLDALSKCVEAVSRAQDIASYVVSTNYDSIIELTAQLRRPFTRVEVPSQTFQELEKNLEASTWMLELDAGWDEPDAQAIAHTTWTRAAEYARKLAQSALAQFSEILPIPRIGPVADGSIDLFWNDGSENLLINIPSDMASPATFDGVRPDGSSITGSIVASDDLAHLTAWLLHR